MFRPKMVLLTPRIDVGSTGYEAERIRDPQSSHNVDQRSHGKPIFLISTPYLAAFWEPQDIFLGRDFGDCTLNYFLNMACRSIFVVRSSC